MKIKMKNSIYSDSYPRKRKTMAACYSNLVRSDEKVMIIAQNKNINLIRIRINPINRVWMTWPDKNFAVTRRPVRRQ